MRNKLEQDFLENLLRCHGPSGFEEKAQKVFKDYASRYCDELFSDVHGNVIAIKRGFGHKKIMITAHIDEIGFMVKYIDEYGFLRFSPIGGVDAALVQGSVVKIHNRKNIITGVIGKKPIHLIKKNSKNDKVTFDDLWIDIGVSSQKEAESLVSVGDSITFNPQVNFLCNSQIVSKSIDDRIGVFIISMVLKKLKKENISANVYFVTTVQEEIGLRGAVTSSYNIKPDIGIAVDVTHATDYPSIVKDVYGDIRLGRGCVLAVGANTNPNVRILLENASKKVKARLQYEAMPRNTGTDANAIQLSRGGVATGIISIPARYVHSAIEVVSLDDVQDAINIISEFLKMIDGEENLIP